MVRAFLFLLLSASAVLGQSFTLREPVPQSSACLMAFDDMESYVDGSSLTNQSGGTCWNGNYNDSVTVTGIQASDDMESYTDAYNLTGLSGGVGSWAGNNAYNFASGLQLEVYDTLDSYTDSAGLNGLNAGNWNGGGAYSGRGFFAGPLDIPGMAYYWNYTNLTTAVNVTNWADQIVAKTFSQGASAKQPTNSVNGVYFSGSSQLTNAVTLPQSKFSIWISYKLPTAQAGYGGLLSDSGGTAGFFIHSLSFQFYPLADSYAQAANVYYDTVYSNLGTGVAGGGVTYTNGVAAIPTTDKSTAWTFNYIGGDNGGENYKGFIKFIGIWTNTTLSANDAVNLATYGAAN